jgi:hypothetical protein
MTLALAIAIAVAALLAGCGGGTTGQAKDLATKAKSLEAGLTQDIGDLGKEIATLFTAVSAGVPDKAKFQSAEQKIKAKVDGILKSLETMKPYYDGIKKLKGVDPYAQWADLQLQALELTRQSMDSINKFLEQVDQMYASGTLDQTALAQAVDHLDKELADQSGKTAPLMEQANQVAQQNKLF